MKTISSALVALIIAIVPATAATIAPTEAASHVGQSVTVEGIASVHVSRNATFIDLGGKYPNQAFSAVVFRERQAVFGNLTRYNGKLIDVDGTIREYRSKPEIIVIDPSELRAK
jgi:hypothetical protein